MNDKILPIWFSAAPLARQSAWKSTFQCVRTATASLSTPSAQRRTRHRHDTGIGGTGSRLRIAPVFRAGVRQLAMDRAAPVDTASRAVSAGFPPVLEIAPHAAASPRRPNDQVRTLDFLLHEAGFHAMFVPHALHPPAVADVRSDGAFCALLATVCTAASCATSMHASCRAARVDRSPATGRPSRCRWPARRLRRPARAAFASPPSPLPHHRRGLQS